MQQDLFSIIPFVECFDHGKEYKMNVVKYKNGTKYEIELKTEQECQNKCKDEFYCKFWTWNKNTKICEYKNITEEGSTTSEINYSVVSGPKVCGMYLLGGHVF